MIRRVNLADLGRRLNLRKRPRSWGGDCPACSYHGAFALKIGKYGGFRAFCANGCTLDLLDDALTRALGADWKPPARLPEAEIAAQRAGKQAAAARLFAGSTPTLALDPSGCYLTGRGLSSLIGCPALRYRGDCNHRSGGRYAALVAEVLDADAHPIAIHRTYLDRQGRKANLDPAKMTLGPMWGGAVRLTPDPAPRCELVVGEGIESSASAGLMLGLPAWAALSAGNLGGGLVLPEAVRSVTITADADPVGQREAYQAARRWRAQGRTVRLVVPDRPGQDFNDLLVARRQESIHAG